MKIIRVDNFARETIADDLVAENINNICEGEIMIKALQDTCSGSSSCWYRLVEDNHKLSRGMLDII